MIWGILITLFSLPNAWAVVGTEEIAQALIQSTALGHLDYTGFVADRRVTDMQVVMRVSTANLDQVEKYGFMNQFQSKHSHGSFSHAYRTTSESTMVGLSGLPIEPKSLRPKYGTLHFDLVGGEARAYDSSAYGEVVFVFGRHILPRTTWSNCDSLGSAHAVCPVSSTDRLQYEFSSYPEAQVWGDLDLSDVEMIVIDSLSRSYQAHIVEYAKRNGIDVYETDGKVGATNAVLRSPEIKLLHEFSSKRIRRESRILLSATAVRNEIKAGLTPGLAHWASIVAPDLLASHSLHASISDWGGTFGAKPEYHSDPASEYRDAQQNTIEGLEHIFSQAGGRNALKAAIVRYFRRELWIPEAAKDRMEERLKNDSHSAEIKEWMATWARRAKPITKGDGEYAAAIKSEIKRVEDKPESIEKERAVAAIEVIKKESTVAPDSVDDIDEIFQEIKKLIKEVRHGESEDLRRLSLGALNKILKKRPIQDVIAEKFVRNERFAQVVYRHSDQLDIVFLRTYFAHLKNYDKRESAQDRAMRKCAELLGESA